VTLVVDASVAAQWVLSQEDSERAARLRTEETLIAPSLITAEIGSAIWKAVRRGDVIRSNALVALEAALLPFDKLVAAEDLPLRALELAIELDHPIYDCFYLALAERERCPIVSADAKLLAAAKKKKGIELRKL
jgi:predicted nucleic acid-binding protein